MTEPQPVTDEQLAAWKALAETARTEAWQFTSPILRDAVPALIAEVERMRAVVADRAAVVNDVIARVEEVNESKREATGSNSLWYPSELVDFLRALATQQEKDHG